MLITTLGVRAILSVLAVNVFGWGLWGAWIALFMDQGLRAVLILHRYSSGRWKEQLAKRTAGETAAA
jgi:Na+-driven multidrug efflux pump